MYHAAVPHCFSWLNNTLHYVDIDHIWFSHSLVDGHLGCFHLLATINSTALNTRAQVFVGVPVFNYLGM